MLLLVLWEELDSPLELDVLAEGAVLSLLEVLSPFVELSK